MTLENLKNYLKEKTDVGDGIALGAINGNQERFLGVYPGKPPDKQRICLGGPEQTLTEELYATVLIHWGKSMSVALAKAQQVWQLFYAAASCTMDGATVFAVEPGGGPVPVGRDDRGIFEFVINLKITCAKE